MHVSRAVPAPGLPPVANFRYCQKIWLFLEAKRVPFRVKKVTM